jgi:hypothetical protein
MSARAKTRPTSVLAREPPRQNEWPLGRIIRVAGANPVGDRFAVTGGIGDGSRLLIWLDQSSLAFSEFTLEFEQTAGGTDDLGGNSTVDHSDMRGLVTT